MTAILIVVAVFLGNRPTGRHAVQFVDMVREGDGLRVDWIEMVPGPGCPTPQPITSAPYAYATVTKVDGAVRFVGAVGESNCGQ